MAARTKSPDALPFAEDNAPRAYDRDSAGRLLDALSRIVPVFERFRAGFTGKASPVHFFWGSFDLAVTRFSGREAPRHPGGIPGLPDRITREAYSHEVSSAGFWPGGASAPPGVEPFSTATPIPNPPASAIRAMTSKARSSTPRSANMCCPMPQVRTAPDPEQALMAFLQSTYNRAADLAHWDRANLEREPVAP